MRHLDEAFSLLDRYIEEKMRITNVPGMAVGVTDGESELRISTHGYANVAEKTPVTPETLFEIGSTGKSFTSIVLLQLVDEGLLDLHKPVTDYLPWFEIQTRFEPVTLHHLMTHTAGITHGPEMPGEARYEVWSLRETEATAPPGTFYHYSDSGYKTLGVLLEEVLGLPYGEIIQKRILDPLGMTATEPIVRNETRKRLAVGYEWFYDDRPPPRDRPIAPATWLEHAEGAGSIASTPADMAAYLRMLINRGHGRNGRILSEEGFRLLTERVIRAEEEGTGLYYGCGLVMGEDDGRTTISHGGGMVGFYAHVVADMDDGLGVVAMMNGPGGRTDEEVANTALRLVRAALHHQDLPDPTPGEPMRVEECASFAGSYRVGRLSPDDDTDSGFTILAEDERVTMHYDDEVVVLEPRSPDAFYVEHPNFGLFPLRFGRSDGRVVEAFCGSRWYVNDDYDRPTDFDYPEDWTAFPGHYRSHNPWLTNFRVVLRKGSLTLIYPSGEEEPMEWLDDGIFRVGEDDLSPERIRFDAIVNGQALRANLSNGDYYRTFTP